MARIVIQDRFRIREEWLILTLGGALALLLRFSLRDFESGDIRGFTGPWYDALQAGGGFRALKDLSSNYSPAYLYLLIVVSLVPGDLPTLYAIKLISVIFDFICAGFVYKLVRLKYPDGAKPLFAFFAVLFAPTVFLNSSFWGQADVLYATGLVACIYFLLTDRHAPAFIAFGLALSLKLQALFLAPLLLIYLLEGKAPRYRWHRWRNTLLVPVTYVLSLVPAWLAGRPMLGLLTTYLGQADFYRSLTKNAPNLYQWLPNSQYDILMPAGLIGATAVVFLLVLAVHKSHVPLTQGRIVFLATFSVIIMPFFLPKMHDRYFFAADVISILFAFYYPRLAFVPLVIGGVSFFSYLPFLFKREVVSLSYLALVLLITIAILSWRLAGELGFDEAGFDESGFGEAK
jgi:Gpi18-like mannosyltransferase